MIGLKIKMEEEKKRKTAHKDTLKFLKLMAANGGSLG